MNSADALSSTIADLAYKIYPYVALIITFLHQEG